ncbi:uncharacterized protein LOC105197513 [Solenopsis invicta]|uniref:uncharacterized protein LOC105197513 n=1 Tax=Solenopsis invicta TaxID=13686 RepID=UPI0005958D73|nr:uncharacterized protein LOC105197513 [Solenopsis invicta]
MAELLKEDPASNPIFSWGMKIQIITPSTPSIIDISHLMYEELLSDDQSIEKIILPEYIDYYCTAMVWFRIVSLKPKLFQSTTFFEKHLLLLLEQKEFAIPEPLFMQLKVLGSVQISSEKYLYPSFPKLPTEKIDSHGGYYGPINEDTHNLYEEIPCLGVLSEAVRKSVSEAAPGRYISALSTEDISPNENLLGYFPLGQRHPEAKNLASICNITAENFPEFPAGTGINMQLLSQVSNFFAQTKTFTVETVNFKTLTQLGSIIQATIQKNSELIDSGILEKRGNLIVTSCNNEKRTVVGASIMFTPQLWKTSSEDASIWACIDDPPEDYITYRNERRTEVQHYNKDYNSYSQQGNRFRTMVIKKMRYNNFTSNSSCSQQILNQSQKEEEKS